MWKDLVTAALSEKHRAIITVAQNFHKISFRDMNEIIKYIIEQTTGKQMGIQFNKMYRNETETTCEFLTRIKNHSEYIFDNETRDQKIKEQFVRGDHGRSRGELVHLQRDLCYGRQREVVIWLRKEQSVSLLR
ncbi:hypothetical protein SNEBB_009973 [Seison nebaliae]|nr:hypothetical protein SNEBB_009973 [Seison nebaliae]